MLIAQWPTNPVPCSAVPDPLPFPLFSACTSVWFTSLTEEENPLLTFPIAFQAALKISPRLPGPSIGITIRDPIPNNSAPMFLPLPNPSGFPLFEIGFRLRPTANAVAVSYPFW